MSTRASGDDEAGVLYSFTPKNAGCCNKSWFPLGCSRSLHVVPVTMATRLPRGSLYRGQYPEVPAGRGIVPGSARCLFRSACSRPRPHRGTILRYGRHPFPGFPAGPPRRSQAFHPQLKRGQAVSWCTIQSAITFEPVEHKATNPGRECTVRVLPKS